MAGPFLTALLWVHQLPQRHPGRNSSTVFARSSGHLATKALRTLASTKMMDTPSDLLLQIMAINTLNESLYSAADIELIMMSAAIAQSHSSHSVHLNDRSLL